MSRVYIHSGVHTRVPNLIASAILGYAPGYTRVCTRLDPGMFPVILGYVPAYTRVCTQVYSGMCPFILGFKPGYPLSILEVYSTKHTLGKTQSTGCLYTRYSKTLRRKIDGNSRRVSALLPCAQALQLPQRRVALYGTTHIEICGWGQARSHAAVLTPPPPPPPQKNNA